MSAFKRARREYTKLLMAMAAPTGGGKTMSALEVATGIVGVTGGKIAFIDSENSRALQYAPSDGEPGYEFEHADMQPPFSSERYAEMIDEAEEIAGDNGVIIIDSMSHEHTGPGGYLSWHDQEVERLCERAKQKGATWVDPDKYNYPAWAKPSAARARLIDRMLRCKSHMIVCFRAKEKTKLVKGQIVDAGWQPLTGDELPYEMTTFCFLRKGVPDFDKFERGKLPENMKKLVKSGPISREFGQRFIEWAMAAKKAAAAPAPIEPTPERSEGAAMLHQMGVQHEPPDFVEDDDPGFGDMNGQIERAKEIEREAQFDEANLKRARQIRAKIAKTHSMDGVSDLDGMVMNLKDLIPGEQFETLSLELQAKSTAILQAERAA